MDQVHDLQARLGGGGAATDAEALFLLLLLLAIPAAKLLNRNG